MKTEKINLIKKCCQRFDSFFFRFTFLDYEDFTLAYNMR